MKKKIQIMGILNATPDSFSDGGRFNCGDAALEQALRMCDEGADIIDIGGESSRPGAEPVSVEEEINRVIPTIEALRGVSDVAISIDTVKGEVAAAALAAGATIVNDISGGNDPALLTATAAAGADYILMHMRGNAQNMQNSENLQYDDTVAEINSYFEKRIAAALATGIQREKICLDPGIGFAKTVEQNLEIIARLAEFKIHGCPVLLGASRKSFIGALCDVDTDRRLPGSLAAAIMGALNGAEIIRVHDVAETAQALKVALACSAE